MVDPRLVESLITDLREGMPGGFAEDMEKKFRALLTSGLSKLDLVTREELDVQMQVLARTRARLEALERQVAELEKHSRRN